MSSTLLIVGLGALLGSLAAWLHLRGVRSAMDATTPGAALWRSVVALCVPLAAAALIDRWVFITSLLVLGCGELHWVSRRI